MPLCRQDWNGSGKPLAHFELLGVPELDRAVGGRRRQVTELRNVSNRQHVAVVPLDLSPGRGTHCLQLGECLGGANFEGSSAVLGQHERSVLPYVLNLEYLAHGILVAGVDPMGGYVRPDDVQRLSLCVLEALDNVVSEVLPGNGALVHEVNVAIKEGGLLRVLSLEQAPFLVVLQHHSETFRLFVEAGLEDVGGHHSGRRDRR
mmetsp:Transcript_3660/g.7727  ORF Transcript_3660/g.7727 Transcript_3660/m.7727 type:complete len:204 (+) Transcript_3660:1644-2255(+)